MFEFASGIPSKLTDQIDTYMGPNAAIVREGRDVVFNYYYVERSKKQVIAFGLVPNQSWLERKWTGFTRALGFK